MLPGLGFVFYFEMNSSFLSFPSYFSLFGIDCRKLLLAVLCPQMGGGGVRQILGGWYQNVLWGRGGLFQVQVVKRGSKRESWCFVNTLQRCLVSPLPISPPSLTCKWQKDSGAAPDTCPVCCSLRLHNCYGNCMSQGWVDWLIQAVSQPDGSFEPACLFRPALVVVAWQRVRLLSPVIMKHIKCFGVGETP